MQHSSNNFTKIHPRNHFLKYLFGNSKHNQSGIAYNEREKNAYERLTRLASYLLPGIDTGSIHFFVELSRGKAPRERPPLHVYNLMVKRHYFLITKIMKSLVTDAYVVHIPCFHLLILGRAAWECYPRAPHSRHWSPFLE